MRGPSKDCYLGETNERCWGKGGENAARRAEWKNARKSSRNSQAQRGEHTIKRSLRTAGSR